jgi:hypothetical protein
LTAVLALLQGLWPALRSYWSYSALAIVSLLAWHFDARAVANANAVQIQAAQFKQAQADATVIAQQASQHQQAAYQAKATEADIAYQSQLADARFATARYIASHRVQSAAVAGQAGSATPPTQSGSAAVPASMPTDSVLVSSGDVQACTDAVTYGLNAHAWATTINP